MIFFHHSALYSHFKDDKVFHQTSKDKNQRKTLIDLFFFFRRERRFRRCDEGLSKPTARVMVDAS